MDYLLDTCTLIWLIYNNNRIPNKIKKIIDDSDNEVYVSMSSFWEIEIKHQKNQNFMPISSNDIANVIEDTKIRLIDIHLGHLRELGDIVKQNIHNDPFDHLLLATARHEGLVLLTHDEMVSKYQGMYILKY